MCLLVKADAKPTKKDVPVVVYKVLKKTDCGPYQEDYTYVHGLNVPSEQPPKPAILKISKYAEHSITNETEYMLLDEGYLHAFKDELAACLRQNELEISYSSFPDAFPRPQNRFKVVEMEIPAGTEYYEDGGCVAARALYWA